MPPPTGGSSNFDATGMAPPHHEMAHDFMIHQKQGSAVMIWAIGAFCIFGWEWLLCLAQEYTWIWTKPINHLSVLYVANRYFGLLQLIFVMTLLADVWSHDACHHVYLFEPVGALISTILSQMILGSRVYSVFSQNKLVARLVAFVLVTTLIAEAVIGGVAISTTKAPPSFPGAPDDRGPPCGTEMGPFGWLIAFWAIPLFYYTGTFMLTAWKAYRNSKEELNTPLYNIIRRDGLPYFFFVFIMNLVNVIMLVTVGKTLRPVNFTPAVVLEIVIACRMVLAGEIPERSSRPESKHELEVHPWCADDTMDLKAPASDEK